MKELIEKYNAEIAKHQSEIDKRKAAIKALQDLCTHTMVSDGNDSHYNYYKCSICGFKNKV